MITINYSKEGQAYSDFEVEDVCNAWFASKDQPISYIVSTDNIISFVRVMVAEGVIAPTDVQLQFEGETLEMNEYATIKVWKKGFCDLELNHARRIIIAQNAKRRAKRQELQVKN